jgi:cytidylate kinase
LIVAIDGVVASGKSAVGRRVADALGLPFVDSGLFYRALARLALDRGVDVHDAARLTELARATEVHVEGDHVQAAGEDLTGRLYDNDVGVAVSPLAAVAGVRDAMVPQQRRLGRGGVVMAGRDIGTVVFPNAEHKFFLTASLQERMRRRAQQYGRRGERADEAALLRDVAARDRYDSERTVAPLRPAQDAEVVDTDGLSLEAVVDLLLRRIRERGA